MEDSLAPAMGGGPREYPVVLSWKEVELIKSLAQMYTWANAEIPELGELVQECHLLEVKFREIMNS